MGIPEGRPVKNLMKTFDAKDCSHQTSSLNFNESDCLQMNLRYLRGVGMNTFTVDYLMWHHFGRRLDECSPDIVRQYRVYFQHLPNPTNLAMFIESYMNRSPIAISRDGQTGPQLNVPVLQIVGAGSPFVNDTVDVNTKLDPAHSDWIKVSLFPYLTFDTTS
ncbi:unnamed protein product [Nippostrongylus brasiliensis]|uniref:NDRG4 protein (inferred by orthology to a S. mansoni protein) n=1 Tax=Nippostrongylus brasiliensis TaxID=27835 RepID=A0A0N4YZR2_NIPBR|nr:unnamed protein product [Nippostrongylus brasiliensis]